MLAAPTWQMIYVSLAAGLFGIAIAFFSDNLAWIFPSYYRDDGLIYMKILMYGLLIPALKTSFAAFFVGQGKAKIVGVSAAIGVILNVGLDYLLIFGIKNTISPMGCAGAAYATVISELAQAIILGVAFFSKKNRNIYDTLKNRKLNIELLLKCLRVGVPISCGNFMSLFAWYILQEVMSFVSKDAATVYSIASNIYVLFLFVGEGINKAIASIAANMIGRRDLKSIKKTWRIFVAISVAFGLMIAIPLSINSDWIFSLLSMLPDDISHLYNEIRLVTLIVAFDVTLETILLSTSGVLAAGGDTKYAAIVIQGCLWIFGCAPTILLALKKFPISVPLVYLFLTLWLCVSIFFVYRRYRSLKWYHSVI